MIDSVKVIKAQVDVVVSITALRAQPPEIQKKGMIESESLKSFIQLNYNRVTEEPEQ